MRYRTIRYVPNQAIPSYKSEWYCTIFMCGFGLCIMYGIVSCLCGNGKRSLQLTTKKACNLITKTMKLNIKFNIH